MEVAERKSILSPGYMLGCYRIENFLGQGGFGVTYLALDTKLEMQVAIKEYMPEKIAARTPENSVQPRSPDASTTFRWGLSRFIKEARTLAKFKHPNIVRIMAVFEQNGTAYMVMEYEQGRGLAELINRPDFRSEVNLKRVIGPVIDGLAEVHRHGYIHRDIKPANILIRNNRTPVLLDFGSARLATGAQTQTLTALVSVGYAPLEQYNESHDDQQGPWTDIYALGAVLYFAITGNAPIDSTLRGSAVLNDRRDPLIPLEQLDPLGFSPSFCRAIDWALNFKIMDRPQSLEQWRSQLLGDNDTVLMPPVRTGSIQPQIQASNVHTARNQGLNDRIISAKHQSAVNRPTGAESEPLRRVQTPPQQKQQISDIPRGVPNELEWDDSNAHSNGHTSQAADSASSRQSRPVVYACLGVVTATVVLGLGFKNKWLPDALSILSTPDSTYTPIDQSELAPEPEVLPLPAIEQEKLEQQAKIERLAAMERTAEAQRQARLQEQSAAELATKEKRIAAEKAAAIERQRVDEAQRLASLEAQRAAEQANRKRELNRKPKPEADANLEAEAEAEAEAQAQAEADAEAERQAAIDKQRSAEVERVATLSTSQTKSRDTVDSMLPITDTDMSQVLRQFNALSNAITSRDASSLRDLTFVSERKYAYFDYLFKNFESIDIAMHNIQASRLDQTVRATLQIKRMQRSNGDIAFPPLEFQSIPIHSTRRTEWSKIQW